MDPNHWFHFHPEFPQNHLSSPPSGTTSVRPYCNISKRANFFNLTLPCVFQKGSICVVLQNISTPRLCSESTPSAPLYQRLDSLRSSLVEKHQNIENLKKINFHTSQVEFESRERQTLKCLSFSCFKCLSF